MKLIISKITNSLFAILTVVFSTVYVHSQTTVNFGYTGAPGSWVVPSCVSSVTITVAGGEGGGPNGLGGNGAIITSTFNVTAGQVIDFSVGGSGNGIAGGYGGGGAGVASTNGNAAYNSSGGGGASIVFIGGNPYIIAAGGGGAGGGSGIVGGGNGGCATGSPGFNTFGAGGGGGSQVAGGSGGAPWAGTPPGGFAGSLGQGGAGGPWQTASGGGGGGGYYGGGGGGNDGCCTGANGGGGGGGGSSLVPAGAGCVAGTNVGNGYVSITYNGGLNAVAANTGPYCEGDVIQLSGLGGVNYSWTGPNGFVSNVQNPTIPASTVANSGTYTLIVTDPACPNGDTTTTDVLVKPMPNVDPTSDQIICDGSSTAAVAFTGLVPGTNYNWTNDNTGTGLAAAGLGDIAAYIGTAPLVTEVSTITVTPSLNGCIGTPDVFTITVLLDPTITVSNDTIVCENGTAHLVANGVAGGGGPYIYHWDFTGNTSGTQDVNPAVASSYTVYVESITGCISDPVTINVDLHPPLAGWITPNDTICPGYPTDISAGVIGGIGVPYTFVWSSGETQTGPNNHTISANPPITQNYIVTITDGCETTPVVLQTNIRVAPLPVPQYTVLNPEQCEPAIFDIVNTTDPTLSQYIYWLVDGEQVFVNQDTITTIEMWAGTYDMQMIVTTYEGCVDSLTFFDALEVKPKPVANFKYTPNPILMFNTDVTYLNYSLNGYTYQWFFEGGNPSQSTQTNVHVQYPDGVTGVYEVTLITTSELGCVDTMIQDVIVFPEVLIYAPNTFTPDGDEYNQDWRVFMEGIDVYDFELLIFNRWGELIWESHDITIPWDGTYHGDIVPAGTYNWVIRTRDMLNDKKYTYNGHINVLR